MSHKSVYGIILAALVVLGVDVEVIVPAIPFVGLALGLPLVLILPGYALLAAIFPDQAPKQPQRILFTVGLSLAVTILGGYLLNLTPWGLRAETWAALLGGVTVVGLAVAAVRRQGYPSRPAHPSSAQPVKLGSRQWVLLAVAVLNVIGAVVVARVGAQEAPSTRFTQLWILPSGQPGTLEAQIGVSNQEQTVLQYRLTVDIGEARIAEWPSLTLQPGEKWETLVALPAGKPTADTVYATLYRQDRPGAIYRQVMLRGDQ